jgi:limonene-1,2-epoxide hydrolase
MATRAGTDWATASATGALRAYCERFAALDADGVVALFADHAVVEIPLVGRVIHGAEVAPVLRGILSTLTRCEVDLIGVADGGRTAIGEGRLAADSADGSLEFAFAAVVEVDKHERIVRLSEYFDTDPILPLD